jgi:zinc/manganese transport system permease protein
VFQGFMVNAWVVASIVAVVAGVVGFFVVLRGSAFVAHAIPNGAFAGAAGATLAGINTIVGLGVFAVLGALGIAWVSRRGRRDVATALVLVFMLGLGALFLSMTVEYAPQIYSLLFGEVLGISPTELAPTIALAAVCVLAIALLYRPLMLSSVLSDVAEARGIAAASVELCFLLVVALATTMTVPVVGTLLIFSLMVGPPAAARSLANRPGAALGLSVALALMSVWAAIAISYETNYPIGFFIGTISAAQYLLARVSAEVRERGALILGRASEAAPASGGGTLA